MTTNNNLTNASLKKRKRGKKGVHTLKQEYQMDETILEYMNTLINHMGA